MKPQTTGNTEGGRDQSRQDQSQSRGAGDRTRKVADPNKLSIEEAMKLGR
jgi:hypothetical protein